MAMDGESALAVVNPGFEVVGSLVQEAVDGRPYRALDGAIAVDVGVTACPSPRRANHDR
jgi:hypothetical protein